MVKYARDTSVSSEQSRGEIERTLRRYGADQFAYATSNDKAMIGFMKEGRQIRFMLPLPDPNNREFTHTPELGKRRSPESALREWEQACRQRWRALGLVIKAKLEACECGISVFEDEFMANIVLPGGATVSDFMRPQIERAYLTGKMPALLPMLESGEARYGQD